MQRSRQQNATQKLLDLIRKDRSVVPEDTGVQDPLPTQQGRALSFRSSAKHLNLGVFISQTHIALALTSDRGPARQKVLVQWQTLLIPENSAPGIFEFSRFLNRSIVQFLGGKKKVTVWCALDSALVKLKQLIIPDLPPSKIATAAFWGLKKEAGFNDTMEILDFEVLGDVMVDGLKKKEILAYSVPKIDVAELQETFSRAGFPLAGITAIPFAMQNFVRTGQIPSDHDYFALVNISWDNSEIFCFSKNGIMLVRSLRTGSLNLVEDLDIPEGMDPIDFLSAMDQPETQAYPGMQEAAERLISKIIRTGDYCAQNFTDNIPLQQYTFYGHADQCVPFMNQAQAMIPALVTTLKPSQDTLPSGMESELPRNAVQRNQVLTAFSIALSAFGMTPNFIYTFSDRQRTAKERKMTVATLVFGLVLLAGVGAAHFYMNTAIAKGRAVLSEIRQEQTRFGGDITEAAITRTIDLGEIRTQATRHYVRDYLPLAVVSEICRHTPGHIKLTKLTYTQASGEKDSDPKKEELVLTGRVTAHPYSLDASLGNYIITLSESPVFGDIDIQDKTAADTSGPGGKATLTFTALLEVL